MDTSAAYLSQFLGMLATPFGLIGAFIAVLVAVGLLVNPKVRWPVLAMLVYVSTLSPGEALYFDNTLIWPFEPLRWVSRQVTLVLTFLLLIPGMTTPNVTRLRIVSGPMLAFFGFQVFMALRLIPTSLLTRGLLSLITFVAIFLSVGVGMSKWLQTKQDFRRLTWAIVFAGLFQVGGSLVQVVVNPGAGAPGGRLAGTMSNAQALGLLLSFTMPCILYLLSDRHSSRRQRLFLMALCGLIALMLLWSGSRTGVLSTLIAVFCFYRARVGRLMLLLAAAGIMLLMLVPLFQGSTERIDRFSSTHNSRAEPWRDLYTKFVAHPITGSVGETQLSARESSYLSILASFGIVGGCVFAAFVLALSIALFNLWRRRTAMGSEANMVDFMISAWGMVMAAAFAEGFLVAVSTFYVFFLYGFLCCLTFAQDLSSRTVVQRTVMPVRGAPPRYPRGSLSYQRGG
ncbi:MAG TPA: O-antigen ligase family protein [Phycisphaerae bacterium]|nr:O-antigen ligase family protein [Phycisphaerae bacterium]HRW55508.1 O-antigen ligase family protein [Phycisphaerae bacterium]